jgi:5-methylcytosine-specific restriction endonuclease McrA
MKVRYYPKISEQEILEDLRRAAKILNKRSVSSSEYRIHGSFADSTVKDRFGSWNKGILTAGLKICDYGKIPLLELLINLENVWNALGRIPQKRDMHRPQSAHSACAYRNNFGSWSKAVKELKKFVKDKEKYIEQLNMKQAKQNQKLNRSILSKKAKKNIDSNDSRRNPGFRLRYIVLSRDRFKCRACGASPSDDKHVKLEIDHTIPWSKGGKTEPDNLQTLCSKCNSGKSNF